MCICFIFFLSEMSVLFSVVFPCVPPSDFLYIDDQEIVIEYFYIKGFLLFVPFRIV